MKRTLLISITIAFVLLSVSTALPSVPTKSALARLDLLHLMQANPETCRAIDNSLSELDAPISDGSDSAPGRVISLNDGTMALLLVMTGVDGSGNVTAVDFAASVRISALIVVANGVSEPRSFDPPVRNGSNITASDGGAIDHIAFCYRINIPSPPQPGGGSPVATTAPGSEESTPTPSATSLSLDLSAAQTASAEAVTVQQTATASANDVAAAQATAQAAIDQASADATTAANAAATTQAGADAIAATATVEAAAAATTIASAEAGITSAQATIAALEATVAAPTSTAPATATATAVSTVVAYQTSGDTPFADWGTVDGWDLSGKTALTGGDAGGSWLIVPAPTSLGANQIAEIDFRVTGGEVCPRNFGVAVRGSDDGFYAGGIEWGCQAQSLIWVSGESEQVQGLPSGASVDGDWHTLQVSAIGDAITVTLDGTVIATDTSTRFQGGKLVAIWSNGVALEIQAVRVYETSP